MNNELDDVRNRCVVRTSKLLVLTAAIVLALPAASQAAAAQGSDRSGKNVVEALCVTCHGTGVDGAPKIGDKKAWSVRTTGGLSALSKNALDGIRKMPPHGGNPGLSDTEIKRAIVYMVNQADGHWVEPMNKTARVKPRSGKQVVQTVCFKCHETGVGGAPKIGDRADWAPRVKQGFEALSRSAINGHGGMPSRGGVSNLTGAELRAAIEYMWNPVAATPKAPATAVVKPEPKR